MLTHIEEPFKAKQFGGDPASLQHVTSYLTSMSELARNREALKQKGSGKGDEDTPTNLSQRDQAKGNKKGKQREKEKDKQTTDSRSARRRARRRDRCEAWEYAEIVWVYFSFLDGGSPHKTSDQERLLRNALNSTWTSIHAEYAGYMHDEINRYIRL